MDYKTLYTWAPQNLLDETSDYTSHELIVILRKSKCHFGREDDRLRIIPCREDELVCYDESWDPKGPFYFFYTTVFKKVLLHLLFLPIDLVTGWLQSQALAPSIFVGICFSPYNVGTQLRWDRGDSTCWLHSENQVSTGLIRNKK